MRLGLYLSAQSPPGADPRGLVEEQLALVRAARAGGLASVLAPQHFLTAPTQMLQPVPLLGRIAAEAGEMTLGAGILLLPLLNPVEVAEHAATLAALAPGRFVLGVGMGYRGVEDAAFALPPDRVRAFTGKLAVVRRLLEGESVTAEGPGYRLEGARLALRPARRPPIWMAANGDAAVRRAARLADTWLINPHASARELERQVALFRRERGGDPPELPIVREACVAPTDEEAVDAAGPHLAAKYGTYVDWGQDRAMPAGDTLRRGFDELRAGRFILGSPRAAAAQIRELRDRLGVSEVILRLAWPGLPARHALRSLRLVVESVAPLI